MPNRPTTMERAHRAAESRERGATPLPAEARRVLWDRMWARLLGPTPDDSAGEEPASDRRTDPGGASPDAAREGR